MDQMLIVDIPEDTGVPDTLSNIIDNLSNNIAPEDTEPPRVKTEDNSTWNPDSPVVLTFHRDCLWRAMANANDDGGDPVSLLYGYE